ncbi:hypothetical protein, partial [Nocardia abscessus]|uniref:hypothetical protein n=1 Tax=Nocardia abscessus TaxID=120957 RepID=UPI002457412D
MLSASRRTARLLTPGADDERAEQGIAIPGADAVVYLLRRLDAADVQFLGRAQESPVRQHQRAGEVVGQPDPRQRAGFAAERGGFGQDPVQL